MLSSDVVGKTDQNKYLNEIFLLRIVSCLAVLFYHVIGRVIGNFNIDNPLTDSIRLLALFGTPTFIFISEFLIAKNYKSGIPQGFLKKRFKIILIPYVFFGLVYAVLSAINEFDGTIAFSEVLSVSIWSHLVYADYHGYFILIIIQFYILHVLLHKFLSTVPHWTILIIAFLINVTYLVALEVFDDFGLPGHLSWIPFTGWVFYFVLAFYVGRYFENVQLIVKQNIKTVLSVLVLVIFSVHYLYFSGISTDISSKRVDNLLYTTLIILGLIYIGGRIKRIPSFLMQINNYSFSIYLLHPLFLAILSIALPRLDLKLNGVVISLLLFFGGLYASIFTSYFLNKFKLGKYLVGKVSKPQVKKIAK